MVVTARRSKESFNGFREEQFCAGQNNTGFLFLRFTMFTKFLIKLLET